MYFDNVSRLGANSIPRKTFNEILIEALKNKALFKQLYEDFETTVKKYEVNLSDKDITKIGTAFKKGGQVQFVGKISRYGIIVVNGIIIVNSVVVFPPPPK